VADPILDAGYDPLSDGAVRDTARAVRPKDAATLILVRRDGAPKLLMGRRHGGHAFMPSKWVFPGGAVDRFDARAPAASELRAHVARRLGARARGLAMAAVRETFEEAGLLLAKAGEANRAPSGWATFLQHGLPDLAALDYVARAITPPYRPRRFDARFFQADASALLNLERLPGTGELEEIAWVPLDEVQALDLPSITRFVVSEVAQRLEDPRRAIPFVRMVRGARRLDWL
jgi:8-oxo-dGTP pyrophosphatase MutT (NUDIX family)